MNVFIIAALTVDGFIGGSSTHRSFEWTSAEDKQFYVDMIKRAKTVVMGATTFKTFSRYPRGLTYVIYTNQPEKFVNPRPDIITTIPTNKSPQELLKELEERGCSEVAISGGASIYTQFLKAGVVNKLYLTIEPILFGSGVGLLNESLNINLKLIETKKLNDQTLLLEYDVIS